MFSFVTLLSLLVCNRFIFNSWLPIIANQPRFNLTPLAPTSLTKNKTKTQNHAAQPTTYYVSNVYDSRLLI